MSGHLRQNVSDQCLLSRSLKLNHEKIILLQRIPIWNHFYCNILYKVEIKDKEGGLTEFLNRDTSNSWFCESSEKRRYENG